MDALRERDFDIQAAGRRLRVRSLHRAGAEDPGAPTLVFLHEGLGSIGQWRDFPAALARTAGLPALVYDRYGHGASEALEGPRDPGYLEEEAHLALPGVLEACGVSRPFLVGHSDGGTIALLFGARYPERPLGIITEAAHVFVEPKALEGIALARRAFGTTDLRERLARHHGAHVDSTFQGWSGAWLSPERRGWSMTDRLGAVAAPVLAIQGEEDEYGTPLQLEAIARGVRGGARSLLLPGCGHVPHFQAEGLVLESMSRFIRETLQSRPLMTS